MDLAAQLTEASSLPAGSRPELVAPAITAYFAGGFPRELAQQTPEQIDALFRHLSGKTWAGELVAQKQVAMAHDRLLALGFRDAAWSDVEAFIALNSIPTARILHARLGRDSTKVLLELAAKATSKRVKHSATAAAIANSKPPARDVEANFTLLEIGWEPLGQAALRALGPERAGDVALRTLRALDDQPEFRDQALAQLLPCFGPPISAPVLASIAERVELLHRTKHNHLGWEGTGELLARSKAWVPCLDFMILRSEDEPSWRRSIRALLDVAIRDESFVFDPSYEEFIDPAGAATLSYDVWQMTNRLLTKVGGERASQLLLDAKFAKPTDLLRFVVPGLTPPVLARFAEAHVGGRDEKDLVIATRLQDLGPGFGDALKVALAEVKPKAGYLKALERNLEAPVYAALAAWLKARPEPKKKPAKKKQ